MIAVLQRVKHASVTVEGNICGSIEKGILVLLGVENDDTEKEASFLADKIHGFRMFSDSNGKMNLSIADVGGAFLVVSQFTLCADWRQGRRPGFTKAAPPSEGERLYTFFVDQLKRKNIQTETGIFGAMMDVSLVNDGPVTFVFDTKNSG